MKVLINEYFQSFINLFYPRLCSACDKSLLAAEDVLCLDCLYHLPFTDFHTDKKNESSQQLWGKVDFDFAISMLHLAKSSRVETLLHRLKYKNQPEIGIFLGKLYAQRIEGFLLDKNIDYIIPIPIHRSKYIKRGYNQAAQFAYGLAEILNIPVLENVLMRSKTSPSQITLNRSNRYDNVKDVFEICKHNHSLGDKHVLLVDDVLTTGATISEAGVKLLNETTKLSIATIARA